MTGGRGRGRLYTYRYAVTTRMTPALRWAARGPNSQGGVHRPQSEEQEEPTRYQAEALQLTSLTPYRWATPAHTEGP